MTPPDTEFDPERVVIRDRRRLDPDSGAVREVPASDPVGSDPVGSDPVGTGQVGPDQVEPDPQVAELTADLQRVSAEYANYRKRVERDRGAVLEMAAAGLLTGLLPLLDDIDRAREHGDLDGAFRTVAEALEAVTTKLGLSRYGAVGEPFDPAVHEALLQAEPDPAAEVAMCAAVLQPGYRVGARVLRPARVSVAEPGSPAEPASDVPQ